MGFGFSFKGDGTLPKDAFLSLKTTSGVTYRSRNLRELFKQTRWGDVVLGAKDFTLDPEYAQKLGVDVANLFISQPDSGEQALEICDQLVRSGALDIIVVDSVAALVPKAEIDGEMGDSHVGLQARLMSQALRKMTGTISKTHTCVVFINQIRMKIGVMFGNPETTTGGNALKFYASVRLDVRSIQSIKGNTGDPLVAAKDEDSSVVGKKTKVKVVKNKVAPPLKVATFDIMYGEGISRTSELVELGTQLEIIQKSGSWYSYKDSRLGQGGVFLLDRRVVGNIGKARSYGLELEMDARPIDPLGVGLNLTLQKANVTALTAEQALISGAVPGAKGGNVIVRPAVKAPA